MARKQKPTTAPAAALERSEPETGAPAPDALAALDALDVPGATEPATATGAPAFSGTTPAVRVLRQFRLVFNAVKSHFQQVEKKAGMGGAQIWALSVIQAEPGLGVSALARAMDIHQTTASNLVRGLVTNGLVTVEKKGADKRAVQLRILNPGVKALRRAPGPFSGVLPQALDSLDAETLKRLDQDLGTLLTALDADERAAGIPLAQMQ